MAPLCGAGDVKRILMMNGLDRTTYGYHIEPSRRWGSLCYGFNVETAGDSPVWHKSGTDVLPGQYDDAESSA